MGAEELQADRDLMASTSPSGKPVEIEVVLAQPELSISPDVEIVSPNASSTLPATLLFPIMTVLFSVPLGKKCTRNLSIFWI